VSPFPLYTATLGKGKTGLVITILSFSFFDMTNRSGALSCFRHRA
jgi:hypothetical protein